MIPIMSTVEAHYGTSDGPGDDPQSHPASPVMLSRRCERCPHHQRSIPELDEQTTNPLWSSRPKPNHSDQILVLNDTHMKRLLIHIERRHYTTIGRTVISSHLSSLILISLQSLYLHSNTMGGGLFSTPGSESSRLKMVFDVWV